MENPDRLAHRFPDHETYRLLDYRPVALPVLVLRLGVVVLQHRKLPVPVEFALRAIVATAGQYQDLVGVLGMSESHAQIVIRDLERDQLAAMEGGRITLLPKGDYLLANLQRSETREIEVSALWDLAAQKIISNYVDELITNRDAAAQGLVRLHPKSSKPPRPEQIDVASLQQAWVGSKTRAQEDDEIIRVFEVRGVGRPRVRPAIALAYASEDRKDLRAQVVLGDTLNEELAQNFGKYGWAEQLGLRGLQGQKTSERALRQRVFGGESAGPAGTAHLQLIQRRAILRLKVESLGAAQEAQRTEERQTKLETAIADLDQMEQRLQTSGASELLPFEMPAAVLDALRIAQKSILITTTLPTRSRLSDALIGELEQCLENGSEVRILISDRIRKSDEESLPPHLAQVDRLAAKFGSLEVGFLVDYSRAFYEVLVDDDVLYVANDPPLGERKERDRFRSFAGLRVTSRALVEEYRTKYLGDEALKVGSRIVVQARKHSRSGGKK